MWIAAGEFLCWVTLGLVLGFALHWWKANADPYPDIMDKDDPALNLAMGQYRIENLVADSQYDDAGFWQYHSLRNLAFYAVIAQATVLLSVYSTTEGHAFARAGLCKAANVIGLMPLFCS